MQGPTASRGSAERAANGTYRCEEALDTTGARGAPSPTSFAARAPTPLVEVCVFSPGTQKRPRFGGPEVRMGSDASSRPYCGRPTGA